MILVAIFALGLRQFSARLAHIMLGPLIWSILLPRWRHGAPDAHVSVIFLGVSHATVVESSQGGVATTTSMMDIASGVCFALLTGLTVLVWWCGRQRRPRWTHRGRKAWLRGCLWWHLAGLHSAVWAWFWYLHRWAQRRPLRVRIDTQLMPPCVLCGDVRHTTQEHMCLPQQELERREGHDGC